MVVKVKEILEKTRHVENSDKFKKYFVRGERNVRFCDRILSDIISIITFYHKMANFLIYFF